MSHRPRTARLTGRLLAYAALGLASFWFLLPLLWLVVGSLKPGSRVLADAGAWAAFWPAPFQPGNYREVFARLPLGRFLVTSTVTSLVTVLGAILINSLAAYAFASLRFPGRDLLFGLTVALIVVPFEAIFLPLVLTVSALGLVNSYAVLILPFIANAFYIFLFRQFILDLPRELFEAARLDGATFFGVYRSIVLPLSRPAVATVAVLEFVARWNDFLWPFLTLTDERKFTAQLGLASLFSGPRTDWGLLLAAACTIAVPPFLVFLALQRFIAGDAGLAEQR